MSCPPLKILFLGDLASANTISWIEGFRRLGAEVHVASARSDGSDGAIPLGSLKLPPRARIFTGKSDLKKLIKQIQPDILLAYRVTSYGYLASCSGFHPCVIAAQNEKITFLRTPCWWKEKLLGFFARRAVKKADLIHAWSENIADGLKKFGARKDRIMLRHRGIDTSVFYPPRESKLKNPQKPKLISTRSLYPEYRLDELIDVFAAFRKKYPDAELIISGDGPEKNKLEKKAFSLGIAEKVTFTGRLDGVGIAELLRESDIYVSLIRTEGLSSSLLEACACGIVPVVADMPASGTVIENGRNGILLPEVSPDETAVFLVEAFENNELKSRCASENVLLMREKYDRDKNLESFLQRYSELCGKKS